MSAADTPLNLPFSDVVKVRYSDTDAQGHLYFANYLVYADEVLGFAACDGEELDALYVAEAARRQGVGTALLERLKAKRDRLTLWTFQANEGAQRFYRREGFAEVERTNGTRNDEQLPDVRYVWHREDS